MKILNWTTEDQLDELKRRGWIERQREPRPDERRILLTLSHARQTIGEGHDRHQTAVETLPQPLVRHIYPDGALRQLTWRPKPGRPTATCRAGHLTPFPRGLAARRRARGGIHIGAWG